MTRPAVDIVVPFVGSDEALRELLDHLRAIRREPTDTLTVVDNRAAHTDGSTPPDEVLRATQRQSSYFARNRGVERGSAPWIVFLDADVRVEPDLLDRYFDDPAGPRTGMLAGRVEPTLAPGGGPVTRYGVARRHFDVSERKGPSGHEYALTANLAVRREAFEALGGFADGIRSGGDADLSFRMQAAGWSLERRPEARVTHPTRESLRALLRVFVRYGSGAQWLRSRYPMFSPPPSLFRLLRTCLAVGVRVPLAVARGRRDEALFSALDPLVGLAFELGRFLPNQADAGWGERYGALRFAVRDRRMHAKRARERRASADAGHPRRAL